MTEILAPSGSKGAFWAAIANGANAIYMGGKAFSARAFAENFTTDELPQMVEMAHMHGVKVYLTVNTLLRNDELAEAWQLLLQAYEGGVDAVIVQDLGLVRMLRRFLPALPLHASTQMSILNSAGVDLAAAAGIERVILARELSLADLAAVKERTELDLETFVHGALCISYSGQCLMSSMIGGRSGNRGRCAQPCRLEYELVDESGRIWSKELGPYLLSPRDLYGYRHLEDIYALDLAAWKIEGRMKRPEYVATVTRIYRKALDALRAGHLPADQEEDMRQLLQIFNRDHCSGYWYGNAGADLMSFSRPNNRGVLLGRILKVGKKDITLKLQQPLQVGDGLEIWVKIGGRSGFVVEKMSIKGQSALSAAVGDEVTIDCDSTAKAGDRVFKTADRELNQAAQESYAVLPPIILSMEFEARLGQPLFLRLWDDEGHEASCQSEYVAVAARTSPSDEETVRKQLCRLGGSGFMLGELSIKLDEGLMLPASVLNQLRRQTVEAIKKKILAPYQRPPLKRSLLQRLERELKKPEAASPVPKQRLTSLVMDEEQALTAIRGGIKEIYMAAENFAPGQEYDLQRLHATATAAGVNLVMALPRICHEHELGHWRSVIQSWQQLGIDTVLAPNLNSLGLLRQSGWQGKIYGDVGFNAFNAQAAEFLSGWGLSRLALSPELNLQQLQQLGDLPSEKELVVQGAATLMISEYCALGSVVGGRKQDHICSAPCHQQGCYQLRDQKGFSFPLRFDQNCRMHLFNSRQLCLLPDLDALRQVGIGFVRLDLRLYEKEEASQWISLYQQALCGQKKEAEAQLAATNEKYTKGHLYRGV
jgi:putative protease